MKRDWKLKAIYDPGLVSELGGKNALMDIIKTIDRNLNKVYR